MKVVRILLVDDEEEIRRLLTRRLTRRGYAVTSVTDGSQALAMLEQGAFNLAILDYMMPGMNGLELAAQCRLRYPSLKILILTGSPIITEYRSAEVSLPAEAAREPGGAGPSDRAVSGPGGDRASGGRRVMSGRRVLVVDDDKDVVVFLSRLLQRAGYTVLTALDAAQAVTQAHREAPNLILTDIMMPASGGLSILERLTMSTTTGTIPIIVLTGSDDPELEARALAAGVTCVLRKPCDNAVLLECIKTAFGEGG
jgi:CheY-like chemotaxis protein